MRILRLEGAPSPELAAELAEFESAFTYPLGPERRFRISHGADYSRFFASMGRSSCFLALQENRVAGAVACVIRRLSLPEGKDIDAAYLADLKVRRSIRSGRTFYRLVQAARSWVEPFTRAAFGVVMEGTSATPDRYTGRAGLPAFQEVERVAIVRIPTFGAAVEGPTRYSTQSEFAERCSRTLNAGFFQPRGGDPATRSEFMPEWLCREDGLACARLEDTLRAKRLIALDGEEILSAHLSSFGYRSPELGADLIREALRRAHDRGFPALFVAVPYAEAHVLLQALGVAGVTVAPARVYATGLSPGPSWIVNTAEI